MCRVTDDTPDNLAAFLDFLDEQMAERPDLVTPFTASETEGLDTLLAGVSDGDEMDWDDLELESTGSD